MKKAITVTTTVRGELGTVWDLWNGPEQIRHWMHASDDWECRAATNDVRVGGAFSYTLAAKDSPASFDLAGTYTEVELLKRLAYTLADGRNVSVDFSPMGGEVRITQTFEPEEENTEELQRIGWQATLDSFKAHAESHVFAPTAIRTED